MPTRYQPALDLTARFLQQKLVTRIWARDIAAWGAAAGSADARSIATRLGWLDIAESMRPHLDRLAALGERHARNGIEAVYLLGMGGSSLCAEVMRSVLGVREGSPAAVRPRHDRRSARSTTAAGAHRSRHARCSWSPSKSGGTVEVASMERSSGPRHVGALGDAAGRHFVAITDPGHGARRRSRESRGYREMFINPPDIGGRFSALSLFGLVPAALIGAPARRSCSRRRRHGGRLPAGERREPRPRARRVHRRQRVATAATSSRSLLPPSLATLGLWIEQLVAESTGKHGKGALPVVDEPLGRAGRVRRRSRFVAIRTDRDEPDDDARWQALEAGRPSRCCDLSTRRRRRSARSSSAGSSPRRSPARRSASTRSTSRTSRRPRRRPRRCSRRSRPAGGCRSRLPPRRTIA